MKKADSLTGQISTNIAEQPSEILGENKRAGTGHDHIDVINQVFAELELAYHNQYHKAFSNRDSLNVAKKYWLECLAQFSPHMILEATRSVVIHNEFLPSIASIINACETSLGNHGLPTARDAYIEACCAKHPKGEFAWSHPAVYIAGKETGWFELENEVEARVFPKFEVNYKKQLQRVLAGEKLEVEIPPALPEQSSKKLSVEENKSRMDVLRKSLKK